jgi:ABC-type nitrate/sulfonate/bicarbonate transport system substrate-binding protein
MRNEPCRSRAAAFALLLVLGIATVGCRTSVKAPPASGPAAAASATPPPAHLTYAMINYSWTTVPHLVAQAKGFFAQQNLTVDYVVAGQSASTCHQVLAKAANFGECSLNDLIQADQSGANLIDIMGETVTTVQDGIMTKPSINSWSDIKGKTVMVGGPKDNTAYFFHVMARANGVKDTDYNFQYAGASAARFAALKSGAVDVSVLSDPYYAEAQASGFKALDFLIPKYLNSDNYAGQGFVVTPEWAKANSDEAERFIAALLNAARWIYDPANKQELYSIVHEKLNLTQDAFDETYQNTLVDSKEFSADGQITDQGVGGVLKGLVDLGSLKEPLPPASKFYDTTYVNGAHKLLGR